MKNKIIWVDLDEVLAESLDTILEFNDYKINWKIVERKDIINYSIYKIEGFNIDLDYAKKWFYTPLFEDFNNLEIKKVNWSLEQLTRLKNLWYELAVITARRSDMFWEYTIAWIEKHFPWFFTNIYFADHFSDEHKDKHDICKENQIEIMIEDDYFYAKGLAEAWIKTFLLEKPWNNNQELYHENIVRIKSWDVLEIENF